MAGNILSANNSSQNTQNRKNYTSKGNRLSFHGDRHFSYDERGNLTEERRGTGGRLSTKYTYNSQNQLIQVEKEGQTTYYQYDPLGRRVSKQDEFGTTEFLWNGDVLLSEHRNHKEKVYLYEPNSFKPLCFIENNQCFFYHLDHLGTPQELTNWEGQVVWSARYKVYGNVIKKDVEQVENNIRFQGQYYDEETGLHYNRHRYYDPNTGQFTQQDPIGLLGGINNYQYAPNPTGWVDPLGMVCKERYERYKAYRDQGLSAQDATNLSRAKRLDDPDYKIFGLDEIDSQPAGTPFKQDVNGRWHDDKGRFVSQSWPPNDGFATKDGAVIRETVPLKPGQQLDRFGGWYEGGNFRDKGSYFGDEGVPFENRALPPSSKSSPYNTYEVVQEFDVEAGPIAPWFGEPGGAMQYFVPKSEGGVEGLLKSGKIKKTTGK